MKVREAGPRRYAVDFVDDDGEPATALLKLELDGWRAWCQHCGQYNCEHGTAVLANLANQQK